MNNLKEIVQEYLSDVETFLTSVLLEETSITIAADDIQEIEHLKQNLQKEDVFLYVNDKKEGIEAIIALDNEWFGLLSSIMLGVEEKSYNDITRDLLTKFHKELYDTLKPKLKKNGIKLTDVEVEVLTKKQVQSKLCHHEYFAIKLEVAGLADHKVRSELLFGNPDKFIEPEKPKAKQDKSEAADKVDNQTAKKVEEGGADGAQTVFENKETGKEHKTNQQDGGDLSSEKIISARNVEFEEFVEQPILDNGKSRSMDLLFDVDMDVSVELGRIELPLGKLLQLSKGSVIELEKLAGEPVDILVNGHIIAKGEVVVIDEHFGVKVSSLVSTRQRLVELT